MKKYKSELSIKNLQTSFTIGTKIERPTILSEGLDQNLRVMIVNFGTAGVSCCTWYFDWDSKTKFRKIWTILRI